MEALPAQNGLAQKFTHIIIFQNILSVEASVTTRPARTMWSAINNKLRSTMSCEGPLNLLIKE